MMRRAAAWKGVSWVTGVLGALVVKKALRASYRAVHNDADPAMAFDPTNARFSLPEALLWAAAAGVGLMIAKIVSARVAAIGWEIATSTRPPGSIEEPTIRRVKSATGSPA